MTCGTLTKRPGRALRVARARQVPGLALAMLLVTAAFSGLDGCTRYVPKPVGHADNASYFSARSLTDPGLRVFIERHSPQPDGEWPPPSWSLSQLTLAALYFHPDLDVARARWEAARAERQTAGQYPNPTLGVTPGYSTTTSTPSPWIVTSMLDFALETAGRRTARKDQTDYLAEAARLQVAAAAWKIRSRVRSSLETVAGARESLRLLEQQQALEDENVKRIEQRYAAGEVSAFERMQARLAAEKSRLSLRDAEGRAADALIQLAAAIGVTPESLDGIRFAFDELDTPVSEAALAQARAQAMVNRADLLALLAEYAASEAALQLEIARQYPDIQIGPGYEYDQGNSKWSLGLSVTLPLFNRNQGPIAAAEAHRAEAAARFDALQLQVLESVARARAACQAAIRKKADTSVMQADARVQLARAEALLAAGEISAADLVAVRLETSAAALADQTALSGLRQSLGALEDAMQSPLNLPASTWQDAPRAAYDTDKSQ